MNVHDKEYSDCYDNCNDRWFKEQLNAKISGTQRFIVSELSFNLPNISQSLNYNKLY